MLQAVHVHPRNFLQPLWCPVTSDVMYASFLSELEKIAASHNRMSVPQTRTGRRSMRVDTMLKKDKEGTLFKEAWKDRLPGGLADKKQPSDFPASALQQGQRVEKEHTDKPALAKEIAMDHLSEDPQYYGKLKKVEKSAGLMDILKTPIPGTKDWLINTGKQGLSGAAKRTAGLGAAPRRMAGTVSRGGVTSIGDDELRRLGFGDLSKRAEAGGGHAPKASAGGSAKPTFRLQGHTSIHGLPIAIENRKGSVRSGVDADGKKWRTKFEVPYGYLKGTKGKDGEEIDAYVGPNKDAKHVFVVHQHKADGKGHDEDKVMLGFNSKEEAKKTFLRHYTNPKFLGPVSTLAAEELKQKLREKREHLKLSAVDISNDTLYGDRSTHLTRVRKGDVPDRDDAGPPSKLGWDGTGSGAGPLSGNQAYMLSEEKPDRRKKGDVPSRDGTVPGNKVEHQAGPDFMTTLPTSGAVFSSDTGATTRL